MEIADLIKDINAPNSTREVSHLIIYIITISRLTLAETQ